jgi:hypothetical protein
LSAILGCEDTDKLACRPGGIHERTDEIEGRRDTELTAHRRGEAHHRMKPRRETETDPGGVDASSHAVGTEVDDHTEGFEHVGRTRE